MSATTAVLGMAVVPGLGAALEEPDLSAAPVLAGRGTEALDRESLLFASAGMAAAAKSAMKESETALAGVVCGTRGAGEANYLRILRAIRAGDTIRPTWGPRSSFNAPAAELSIRLRATGPCFTVTSGDAAGLEAVLLGCDLIARGQAPALLAGGVDAFDIAGDANEGAAVLALGSRPRGNRAILAYLAGQAIVFTPVARANELREVTGRAVGHALEDAERNASEVDCVVVAPASCPAASDGLEAGLDDVDGLSAPFGLDNARGAVGGAGSTLAALVAVLAVRRRARCALVVALEHDGRALALVVTSADSEKG